MEIECNASIAFLDVLLVRDPDGSLTTSVYRKPTATGKYLSFSSHHPVAHKRSVVRTLYSRAEAISTSLVQRVEEELHVVNTLRRNGYPRRFISRNCKKRVVSDIPASPEPVGTVCLPYVKGLSEAIRRVLTPLNIRVGFKPPPSLRDILTNVKDPVPVISRSDVVYRIPCGECSNSYIGQTMGCRIKEHQHATFEGNKNASALAEHSIDTGHRINWDDAEILDSCNHLRARIMLESWYIQRERDALNREHGPLPSIYFALSQ